MKKEPEREEAGEETEVEVREEEVAELRGCREKGGLREVWRDGALPVLLSVMWAETWERYQFSR